MLMSLRRNSAVAFLAVVAGSAASLAEPPAILDRVPGEAALVVVTRDIAAAGEKAKPLAGLLQGQQLPGQDFTKTTEKLLAIPGIDPNGSVALIMTKAPDPEAEDTGEEPTMLAMVPVADYAAFVQGLGGKAEEAVATIHFDENEAFARKLDAKTALVGSDRESVQGFKPLTGQMKTFQGRLGAAGWKVADTADSLIIVDAQAFKSQIEKPGGLGGQARVPGMGPLGGGLGGVSKTMTKVRESLARDGKTAVIGFSGNEAGLALDLVATFREGTEAAKVFAQNGDSSTLLSRLPNQSYYMAGAADLSAPGVRQLLADYRAEQGDEAGAPSGFDAISKNLEKADGFAIVVGANKAGPMAGVFINTATFIATKDAKGMLEALRANADAMKEVKVGEASIKVDYRRDVAEASGVKFDASTTTIDPDPNDPNAFMAGMMMQTLFGNGRGFSQMAAATEPGLVMTMSQNTPLMSSAIQAAQTGKGLGEEESIKAIRSQLPAQRSMEFYLGSAAILNAVKTGIEDFLGEEIQVPANVPPVALAGSMEGGAVSLRLFVPNAVFVAAEQMKKQFENINGDLEPVDDAPAKKPSSAT